MVGEQQIRPQRCHLVGNKEYQTPPAMSYISPGSSSTATSHTACHIAPVPARITFPCLTLGSFINLPDVFVLLYRLCLAVTRVLFLHLCYNCLCLKSLIFVFLPILMYDNIFYKIHYLCILL